MSRPDLLGIWPRYCHKTVFLFVIFHGHNRDCHSLSVISGKWKYAQDSAPLKLHLLLGCLQPKFHLHH